MRLDTESLRTLKTAIETGSLTAAARQLSKTTSAVSWKLKRLEERLGRKLIDRSGQGIRPTSDARRLLEYAEVIVGAHDQAVQHFRLSHVEGKLIVGITDDLASRQLPDFVQEFHSRHPGIRLEFRVEQQLELLDWFDERRVDMVVLPLDDSMLLDTDIVLWEDRLLWVRSRERNYPLDRPVPLVTFSPRCTYREAALACLDAHGVDYYVSMESPSLAGVQGIVSSGMGVTLINRGLVTDDQCEWPEAKALGDPGSVKFVIRASAMIPAALQDLAVTELRRFLPGKGLRAVR